MGMDIDAHICYGVEIEEAPPNLPEGTYDEDGNPNYYSWQEHIESLEGLDIVYVGSYDGDTVIVACEGTVMSADWWYPSPIPRDGLDISPIQNQQFQQRLQDLGITEKPEWLLSALHSH
jgi:hypothetical protein